MDPLNKNQNNRDIPKKGETEPKTKSMPKLQAWIFIFVTLALVLFLILWAFNIGGLFGS